MSNTMVCRTRPQGKCQAITQKGTRCKNCIGPKGYGGKASSHCTACFMHKQKECLTRDAKRAAAQNRVYRQLATSHGYARGVGIVPKSAQK